MRGVCGYGRYNDDPEHVGCPRAKSDMTPCIARDGAICLTDPPEDERVCVGCGHDPMELLQELRDAGVTIMGARPKVRDSAADRLRDVVRESASRGLSGDREGRE